MSSTMDAVGFKNASKENMTNTYRGTSKHRKSALPIELGAIDHSKAVQKLAKITQKSRDHDGHNELIKSLPSFA